MKFLAIPAIALTVALAGCATEQENRAATGAVIGGAAGALAGQALGGNTGSTVAGAAGGAILGATVGAATTPRRPMCRYRDGYGRIYTAPCERY